MELSLKWQVDAPQAKVFQAFTDPALVSRWWGRGATASAELRPGGRFRWLMQLPGGEMPASGVYEEFRAPERLRFTWNWEVPGDTDTYVAVEFRKVGDGTEILLTHTGFETDQEVENHRLGWNDCVGRLVALGPELR